MPDETMPDPTSAENAISNLRALISEAHAAGNRKALGEHLDALCALAGSANALETRGWHQFLASLPEDRRDRDRLDWMEANSVNVSRRIWDHLPADWLVTASGITPCYRATLREAIDAAAAGDV